MGPLWELSCRKRNTQLVPGRDIAAASTTDSVKYGTTKYFLMCGLGGIVACGSTHTSVVPIDLIKCRIQTEPLKYKNFITGLNITVKEDGYKGLLKGWSPTLIGYSLQGGLKFGFYEFFKHKYQHLLSEKNAYKYRTWLYLASSASAEFIADIALCPMEATKVKLQTSRDFGNSLRVALPKMYATEGMFTFYKGLVPLWARQIPYTMMKFASFERTLEALYNYVVPKPREECSKAEQLVVTFAAGYIAGVFCAIVSHPADVVVSKLNKEQGKSAVEVATQLGLMGMWKGLGPRIVMIGTLTALQWFIYDGFKVYLNIPRPPPPVMPKDG